MSRRETFSDSRHRMGSRSSKERRSVSKVVSAETLFVSRSGVDRRLSSPQASRDEALRIAAEGLEQRLQRHVAQVRDLRDAGLREARLAPRRRCPG